MRSFTVRPQITFSQQKLADFRQGLDRTKFLGPREIRRLNRTVEDNSKCRRAKAEIIR